MKMEIRANDTSVSITGYVNAVDRYSRPLTSKILGRFIEKIVPKAFSKSLERRSDVKLLLNHDKNRELGSTTTGTVKLTEDNIGLRAEVEITDPEVVEKAKSGKLRGWSFGFKALSQKLGESDGMTTRAIDDLELKEVSLIDDQMLPCYEANSIELRAESDSDSEVRSTEDYEEDKPNTEVDMQALVFSYLDEHLDEVIELLEAKGIKIERVTNEYDEENRSQENGDNRINLYKQIIELL